MNRLHLTSADVANTTIGATIGALIGLAAALAIVEGLLRREARR